MASQRDYNTVAGHTANATMVLEVDWHKLDRERERENAACCRTS